MSIADQLIIRGWTKGTEEDHEGRVCLAGAIRKQSGYCYSHNRVVSEGRDEYRAACQIANKLLNEKYIHGDFVRWNDQNGRTYEEVLRFAKELDEVIDYLKGLPK